jgi:hypothetical protein
VAEESGARTDEGTNIEAGEDGEGSEDDEESEGGDDGEDGDECMHDDAREQRLAACEKQRRVAADAPASPRWWCLLASPFALLDARGSLRLVTDAVHEDDALCLALACRALRDAL